MWYADEEPTFRATHDMDIVLVLEQLDDNFIHAFKQYLQENGYQPHVSQSLSINLDKWEFVGLKALGILSPRRGRHNNSPGWSCVSSGTLGKMKNISEPRSVAEWVAEVSA